MTIPTFKIPLSHRYVVRGDDDESSSSASQQKGIDKKDTAIGVIMSDIDAQDVACSVILRRLSKPPFGALWPISEMHGEWGNSDIRGIAQI